MLIAIVKSVDLLLAALTSGTLFGLWVGQNPKTLSPAAYLEQQQLRIRSLSVKMPLLEAIVIVLTLILLFFAIPQPLVAYAYLVSVFFFVVAGAVARLFNQRINTQVMDWTLEKMPTNWQTVRNRWWRWHVVQTFAAVSGLIFLILGNLLVELGVTAPPR